MPTTDVLPITPTPTATPTWEQLHMWWAEMHADPEDLRTAFSDFSPTELEAFLSQDLLLVLFHSGQTLIAAAWLHDLVRDAYGNPTDGWIGGWVAKPFRGRTGGVCWQMALAYFAQHGVHHIHSAINVDNRPSFVFTKRLMAFTVVGVFPQLSQFGGVLTDVHILTLHPEDRDRAWQRAEAMAHQRWPERYSLFQTQVDFTASTALTSVK
ncbi:MAG: hypothetical protein ETSY2_53465 [Candidatus Entotheonella gemina]|uniref:N-acetyltransferase domain-containing protein n=1 Tax=Candidatus Entotheonella gemina TaxID=1429439 RepID=W4L315_9BACT|nr:MAG: hypothetical protein ETSY2_53465 [Candidatus Entotheonella gemina]